MPTLAADVLLLTATPVESKATLQAFAAATQHKAVPPHDWDAMSANLDALGVPHAPPTIRAYSGGHSTYIQDPDGNRIELVQHPLGLKDSQGKKVELVHDPDSLTWARLPGYGPTT